MKIILPTPMEVAMLTVLLVSRYEKEKKKTVSRFRLSRRSLRRMAIRTNLRDQFIDDWTEALVTTHGWIAVPHGEEFLLVKAGTTEQWTKLATARLDDIIKPLRKGDRDPLDAVEDQLPDDDDDDDDE